MYYIIINELIVHTGEKIDILQFLNREDTPCYKTD